MQILSISEASFIADYVLHSRAFLCSVNTTVLRIYVQLYQFRLQPRQNGKFLRYRSVLRYDSLHNNKILAYTYIYLF